MTTERSSISDDNVYPKFCELAATNDSIFKTFRNNKDYTGILEHVTKDEGRIYLELVNRDNPWILDSENVIKYETNDSVGAPAQRYVYRNTINVSPTTARYMKVLSDLHKYFGDLNGKDIAEIGCGYGGQAKIIMDTYNVKSYTLIDLPPVLKLAKKYLESLGVDTSKVRFMDINDLKDDESFDLFISNYAYTECIKKIQLEYFDKVISKSKMGYITANFISGYFNLDYLTKEELQSMIPNNQIVAEEPKTHANNFILLWK